MSRELGDRALTTFPVFNSQQTRRFFYRDLIGLLEWNNPDNRFKEAFCHYIMQVNWPIKKELSLAHLFMSMQKNKKCLKLDERDQAIVLDLLHYIENGPGVAFLKMDKESFVNHLLCGEGTATERGRLIKLAKLAYDIAKERYEMLPFYSLLLTNIVGDAEARFDVVCIDGKNAYVAFTQSAINVRKPREYVDRLANEFEGFEIFDDDVGMAYLASIPRKELDERAKDEKLLKPLRDWVENALVRNRVVQLLHEFFVEHILPALEERGMANFAYYLVSGPAHKETPKHSRGVKDHSDLDTVLIVENEAKTLGQPLATKLDGWIDPRMPELVYALAHSTVIGRYNVQFENLGFKAPEINLLNANDVKAGLDIQEYGTLISYSSLEMLERVWKATMRPDEQERQFKMQDTQIGMRSNEEDSHTLHLKNKLKPTPFDWAMH